MAALLPFLLLWLPPAHWHYGLLGAAEALTLVIAAAAVGAPWKRLPAWGPTTLAFGYLVVVALLRAAGGPSGVASMVLLPVFWLGLCGTRRQLWGLLVGEPVSVALVDIDSFKSINDLHGYPGGDLLLINVAGEWPKVLRPDDVLARIGGDEFAVLMPACTEAEGAEVVKRLRARMPTPSTCSVGLAMWDRAELADHLMVRADMALYDAKRAEKGDPAAASVASRVPVAARPRPCELAVRHPRRAADSITASCLAGGVQSEHLTLRARGPPR